MSRVHTVSPSTEFFLVACHILITSFLFQTLCLLLPLLLAVLWSSASSPFMTLLCITWAGERTPRFTHEHRQLSCTKGRRALCKPFSNWSQNFLKTAHIVCLPIKFGHSPDCGFCRGTRIGIVIRVTYQTGCGCQIEGHPALAWLGLMAPLPPAPI